MTDSSSVNLFEGRAPSCSKLQVAMRATSSFQPIGRLCDERAGGCALISPGGWQSTDGLVVARKTVDARLDEDQAELAVLVLPVALQMTAYAHGLGVVLVKRGISGQSHRVLQTFLMSM